jgi:addiction module RelB/DinJ family antitoxin
MPKSSSVFTRVEPELKAQAEQVLSQLGIPMANAINLYLRQIVLQQGIPFAVKLPQNKQLDMSVLSKEQLDAEIQKGYDDLSAGRVISSKQVREEMQGLFGV